MRGSLCLLPIVFAVFGFLAVSMASAVEIVTIDGNGLTIDPSSSVDLTVRIQTLGYDETDSDTATVSGNMLTRLEADFDPITQQVTSLTGIDFYGGEFSFSDIALYYEFKLLGIITVGTLSATGTGIGGTHPCSLRSVCH